MVSGGFTPTDCTGWVDNRLQLTVFYHLEVRTRIAAIGALMWEKDPAFEQALEWAGFSKETSGEMSLDDCFSKPGSYGRRSSWM